MEPFKYQHIKVEKEKGRMRLSLNRPDKRNALSYRMQLEMNHALLDGDNDKSVHSIIIRGEGKDFCAGFDLQDQTMYGRKEGIKKDVLEHYELNGKGPREWPEKIRAGSQKIEDDIWNLEESQRLQLTIFDMHKPVICEVKGKCLAGGIGIMSLCDLVVAAEDAEIAFPPARDMGVLPTNMLMYHANIQWAKRLLLTGDSISGKDAAQVGIVLKAVPASVLEEEVEGLADRMALIDPGLLTWNKRSVNMALELQGARTLQRINGMLDGMGHQAGGMAMGGGLQKAAKEAGGMAKYFREREKPFGDGMAHFSIPDGRPKPKL